MITVLEVEMKLRRCAARGANVCSGNDLALAFLSTRNLKAFPAAYIEVVRLYDRQRTRNTCSANIRRNDTRNRNTCFTMT